MVTSGRLAVYDKPKAPFELRSFPIRTCSPAKFNQHERLGRPCLAGRIVPQQGETDEEQGPREHSGQGQEAVESVGWQRSPLSRGAATLLRSPSNP